MNPIIAEYKEYEKAAAQSLEAAYQMAMIEGDLEKAYNTLGDLMKFKLIDVDDPRIQKNNKMFKAGGIDKDHRFPLDYRRSTTYIPAWLFGELKMIGNAKLTTVEHLGERLENGYSGQTVFNSFDIMLRFRLAGTTKEVENALKMLQNIYKADTGKVPSVDKLKELLVSGVYRIYTIEVNGNCLPTNREIGVVIVSIKDDQVHGRLYINYAALTSLWVRIRDAITAIKQEMSRIAGCSLFKTEIDPAKFIKAQNELVKLNKVPEQKA